MTHIYVIKIGYVKTPPSPPAYFRRFYGTQEVDYYCSATVSLAHSVKHFLSGYDIEGYILTMFLSSG